MLVTNVVKELFMLVTNVCTELGTASRKQEPRNERQQNNSNIGIRKQGVLRNTTSQYCCEQVEEVSLVMK